MNSPKVIGKIILSIRKKNKHLTQEKFAETIGVTPETVSNIERGLCIPSTKTLVMISETCSVSIDFILGTSHEDDAD